MNLEKERCREELVCLAVLAADRIIMDGSNGDAEELNYLTLRVARAFLDKVDIALASNVLRRELTGNDG